MDIRAALNLIEQAQRKPASRLADEAGQLEPVEATVYHGSPTTGIKAFDPARRGSNTGDRDAKSGFFFFGTERSAEGYLERDEVLKPAVQAKRDGLMAKAEEHKAAYAAALEADLKAAGIDPSTVDTTFSSWALKLPGDVRDQFRNYDYKNEDYALYRHFEKLAHDLDDKSANLINVLNGSVYTCAIRLSNAYMVDMKGAAYSADAYARIIHSVTTNFDPDGIVLRNVLDSEVGRRDTVYIVFDAANIEITDSKVYDNVETDYRSY